MMFIKEDFLCVLGWTEANRCDSTVWRQRVSQRNNPQQSVSTQQQAKGQAGWKGKVLIHQIVSNVDYILTFLLNIMKYFFVHSCWREMWFLRWAQGFKCSWRSCWHQSRRARAAETHNRLVHTHTLTHTNQRVKVQKFPTTGLVRRKRTNMRRFGLKNKLLYYMYHYIYYKSYLRRSHLLLQTKKSK